MMRTVAYILACSIALVLAETNEEFYQELLRKTAGKGWTPRRVDIEQLKKDYPAGCAWVRNDSHPLVFRADLDLDHVNNNYKAPTSFDSREQWTNCPSIRKIWNQSQCGSCWAFAAGSVMSDRICIHKKRQFLSSAEDIIACCKQPCGEGCKGGWPSQAFQMWTREGFCSGGAFGESGTCKPYSIPPTATTPQNTPYCYNSCTDTSYPTPYQQDKYKGSQAYSVPKNNPSAIQEEIQNNGPISVIIQLFQDIYYYSSGVYSHTYGNSVGTHAVRVIGWGVEAGKSYWLVTNSWGEGWGMNGLIKIEKGQLGLESNGLDAGLP